MSRKARAITEIECSVDADKFGVAALFDDDLHEWWQTQFDMDKYTYCGRDGVMGKHCEGCPFCAKFETETIED